MAPLVSRHLHAHLYSVIMRLRVPWQVLQVAFGSKKKKTKLQAERHKVPQLESISLVLYTEVLCDGCEGDKAGKV